MRLFRGTPARIWLIVLVGAIFLPAWIWVGRSRPADTGLLEPPSSLARQPPADAANAAVGGADGPAALNRAALGVAGSSAEVNSRSPDESDPEEGAAPSSDETPLQRLLQPWRVEHIQAKLEKVRGADLDRATRLRAAQFLMCEYIAVHMERAGTGLDAQQKGGPPVVLPAPQQFFKDGRIYCFDPGEFADYDRLKELRANPGSEGLEAALIAAMGYGEELLAIHDENL